MLTPLRPARPFFEISAPIGRHPGIQYLAGLGNPKQASRPRGISGGRRAGRKGPALGVVDACFGTWHGARNEAMPEGKREGRGAVGNSSDRGTRKRRRAPECPPLGERKTAIPGHIGLAHEGPTDHDAHPTLSSKEGSSAKQLNRRGWDPVAILPPVAEETRRNCRRGSEIAPESTHRAQRCSLVSPNGYTKERHLPTYLGGTYILAARETCVLRPRPAPHQAVCRVRGCQSSPLASCQLEI